MRLFAYPLLPARCAALAVALGALPQIASAQSAIGRMLESRLEWHEVSTPTGPLNVALVRPDSSTTGPHPVILALPWGAGTADLVESFVASYWLTEPAARGYYVVSPEVRGTTLQGTAGDIIPALFTWMDAELEYDPERVALVGASNGGRGAFFAAISQPERFGALMVLPGQYDGPAENLAVLEDIPIYFIVGQEDERWVESTEGTRRALESQGIRSALWVAPGQGHVVRLNPRPMIDWIDSALGR